MDNDSILLPFHLNAIEVTNSSFILNYKTLSFEEVTELNSSYTTIISSTGKKVLLKNEVEQKYPITYFDNESSINLELGFVSISANFTSDEHKNKVIDSIPFDRNFLYCSVFSDHVLLKALDGASYYLTKHDRKMTIIRNDHNEDPEIESIYEKEVQTKYEAYIDSLTPKI